MDNKETHIDKAESKTEKLPYHVIFHTIEKSDKYRKGPSKFPKVRLMIFLFALLVIVGFLLVNKTNYHSLYKHERYEKVVEQYMKTEKAKSRDLIYIANAMYKQNISDEALKLYKGIYFGKSNQQIIQNQDYEEGFLNYVDLVVKSGKKNEDILKFASDGFKDEANPEFESKVNKLLKEYKEKLDKEDRLAKITAQIETIKFTVNYGESRIVGQGDAFIEDSAAYVNSKNLSKYFDIASGYKEGVVTFTQKRRVLKFQLRTGQVIGQERKIRVKNIEGITYYCLEDLLTGLGFKTTINTGHNEFVASYN